MNTTVTAMEARKRFGEILNSAFYSGVSTVVERKGKPIAKIVPIINDAALSGKDLSVYAGIWKDADDVMRIKKEVSRLRRFPTRKVKSL